MFTFAMIMLAMFAISTFVAGKAKAKLIVCRARKKQNKHQQ